MGVLAGMKGWRMGKGGDMQLRGQMGAVHGTACYISVFSFDRSRLLGRGPITSSASCYIFSFTASSIIKTLQPLLGAAPID